MLRVDGQGRTSITSCYQTPLFVQLVYGVGVTTLGGVDPHLSDCHSLKKEMCSFGQDVRRNLYTQTHTCTGAACGVFEYAAGLNPMQLTCRGCPHGV